MGNWRDQIISKFAPQMARLTLVADPDRLLIEEQVLSEIRERGFQLIPFEDPITFRFIYESRFRSRWDQGEQTDSVVVLLSEASDLDRLPHDLLQVGYPLSFSLGEIFPNLSYPILTALDRGELDALYDAQERHSPKVLGDAATKEFILRYVFGVAIELIRKPSDLLHVLLRRHYREQRIPTILDEYIVQVVRQHDCFEDWPLEAIVPEREAFFKFLQERWPLFLDRAAERDVRLVSEERESYKLQFPGPTVLPFDHSDIRVYLDNLFLEGLLEAVPFKHADDFANSWIAIGIKSDDRAGWKHRVDRLLDKLTKGIPDVDSRHEDWCRLAKSWAELLALTLESDEKMPETTILRMESLQTEIDAALAPWLIGRYHGLINLPSVPPVMLHHVPRFLARHIDDAKEHKVGLVLMDGLSLAQWIVIRKELSKQRAHYRYREESVFAWIPTITSVSRQAVFSGKPPVYFPDSIHTTDREPTLWRQFWVDQRLTQQEVAYAKGLGDGALKEVKEMIANPKTRVVGLVVDKVDKIMHGMQLGAAGMNNQVRQWAGQPFLANLFDLLLENGFRIFLTSDHGNIEAAGWGRPDEGVVADLRGGRARIYSDSVLRGSVKHRFPDAIEWPSIGLPENYLPLLAAGRSAFVRVSERLVGHGGASLEEVIVPFVQIEA